MKRRDLMLYTTYGLLGSLFSAKSHQVFAQGKSGVNIEWLGHSCFVFRNSQANILVNPFTPLGCTANYRQPQPKVDLVMISSRLLDEGYATGLPNNPQLMVEAGVYKLKGIEFQGIKTLHDRQNGRRFGDNICWKWTQGDVKMLHLGGIASPIAIEQKILMGSPDVLFIPVGGGAKSYNPQEAMSAIKTLKPKIVIPTQYFSTGAIVDQCELNKIDDFLQLAQLEKLTIEKLNNNQTTINPQDLASEGIKVKIFSENNLIK
jgi:L-ascorbate metabolism protein UlaG (beta-lactamase superfamily)